MSFIRALVLSFAILSISCASMTSARAQENAFDAFKQLDNNAKMPKLNAFSPALPDVSAPDTSARNVVMEARLTTDGEAMTEGLSWRVFSPIPGEDGKLPLLASAEGGSADFLLTPGDYFVNVAFGRAGTTKKLSIPEEGKLDPQVMVLDAGGLLLNAISGSDTRIPAQQLRFDIYSEETQSDGKRGLIIADVRPDTIIRLNADTYHIVSEYGNINATIRADIKVEAGKLTEATIQHRAAQVNFKLVSEHGGEAIADTAWSVLANSGDIVSESVSAFPTMVLAEGEYTAIARNKDKIYQKDFTVVAGVNSDVELLLEN
ncbi:hypothetical protein ACQQ2Q_09670 [Agrobacterium sp. ES01]|uniref:hypothetical protein n=1 Tax=Agrobacterium sp. ES01 TaxID=3420714 RepID=UPI003D103DE5